MSHESPCTCRQRSNGFAFSNDQTYTRQELETRKAELEKKIVDYLNGGIEDDKRDDAELGEEHALKHAMILKMKSDEAKKNSKRRGAEIEPLFGNWKSLRNFWFFLLRGRKKVLTEVKITATATNFGKLVRLAIA